MAEKLDIRFYLKPEPKGSKEPRKLYLFLFFPCVLLLVLIIQSPKGPAVSWLLFVTLFIPMLGLFIRGVKLTWRHSTLSAKFRDAKAADVMANDRPFHLLLRPFKFDGSIPVLPDSARDIAEYEQEEKAVDVFNSFDEKEPVELFDLLATRLFKDTSRITIAVGERKTGHIAGPGLLKTNDEDWKSAVSDLLDKASTIFIMPWPTEGTLWEINEIIKGNYLSKTWFVMPPLYGVFHDQRFVTYSGLENGSDRDFYFKVPVDKLEKDHPSHVLASGFDKALQPLRDAKLATPSHRANGGLFAFINGEYKFFDLQVSENFIDYMSS